MALTRTLEVNGLSYQASFSDGTAQEVLLPLLDRWRGMAQAGPSRAAGCNRPLVVFLCAPPGAGKSTLALFLELLAREQGTEMRLQALGLDGFHFPQEYLRSHVVPASSPLKEGTPLSEVKGAPESFDLASLEEALQTLREGRACRWPLYDRRIHNPVRAALPVVGNVLLIEGNWLLLDEPGWRELPELCDDSVFLCAREDQLRDRLVGRKVAGGSSRESALDHYEHVDGPNIRRLLAHHLAADLTLRMGEDGGLA